jgi:Protein of unknown function (DUF3224)
VVRFLQAQRQDGSASFVGIERVSGRIADRAGTFLLQDAGTLEGENSYVFLFDEDQVVGMYWHVDREGALQPPRCESSSLDGSRGGGTPAATGLVAPPCARSANAGCMQILSTGSDAPIERPALSGRTAEYQHSRRRPLRTISAGVHDNPGRSGG